jgi:lysophospholipase L1-like esterase
MTRSGLKSKGLRGIVAMGILLTGLTGHPILAGVVTEDWDWVAAMAEVAAAGRVKNREGVVLSLGDSLTYANPSTRWARSPAGGSPGDLEVLKWSHAGTGDDSDGWHLASVDAAQGRSETAASGIRTDEFLAGGKAGLPPLGDILSRYKPQVAFVLLGANDASAGRKPDEVAGDMAVILDLLLARGTIPVLQLLAPRADPGRDELTRQYNRRFLEIARGRKIPVIDLYGEFLTRAPGDAWKSGLLHEDGVHFTHEWSGGPPTEENLAQCGYLLRCWLSVQKLREIKTRVLDQMK